MQACLSVMREFRIHFHSSLQEEIDDSSSAEFTGPGESVLYLLRRRRWLQAAIVVKKAPDDVEPPDSGCSFQVQPRAMLRKEFCSLAAPVLKTANDRAFPIRAVD